MDTRGRGARIIYRLVKVAAGASVASRTMGVTVGDGCRILSKIVTSEPWLIHIGDRVTISTGVQFITHDGSGWLVRDERGRRFRYAPIRVGSNVFIGTRVVIMPGVEIGDNCVIAAGSVVTKSIPSNTVAGGVPARFLSHWEDFRLRLTRWPSEEDMSGGDYRTRVDSIADQVFNAPISMPD